MALTQNPAPLLDSHAHAFPDAIAAAALKTLTAEAKWIAVRPHHDGTVAGLLAAMDRAGIARTILCSVATRPSQVPKITAWSAAVAGPRIIPFASIHPDFADVEGEVRRIADLGIKGLKFHPQYMGCAVDDPRTVRIARAAADAGLALACHAGYDLAFERDDLAGPRRMRALHEAVSGLRLQACHLGGWQCWEESLQYIVGLPIYLETSFCLGQCPPELIEQILRKHPPEFLQFGTDSPWAEPAEELAKFRNLPLPEAVITGTLWENGHRFAGVAA